MKRKLLIAGIVAVVALGAAYWVYTSGLFYGRAATPEQAAYLPTLLRGSTKVVVRQHPKVGGRVFAEVTDRQEVAAFVTATRVTRVDSMCACFGLTEVDFTLATGDLYTINYNDDPTDTYIKFGNPWSVQAMPSPEFRALVRKYARP